MNPVYGCSLVLVFEKSNSLVDSAGPLSNIIRQLESSEIFSTVTSACLDAESEPNSGSLDSVIQALPSGDVIVIPFFASDDRRTHARLTSALQASIDLGRHRLKISPAIGAQSQIASAVLSRLVTSFIEHHLPPNDTTVVVLGSGAERNPDSGLTTYGIAGVVRSAIPNLSVSVAFLNQRPFIDSIPRLIKTCHTLVIPFLTEVDLGTANLIGQTLAGQDVDDLKFPQRLDRSGQICICDMPVGWYPEMASICLELATDEMGQSAAA